MAEFAANPGETLSDLVDLLARGATKVEATMLVGEPEVAVRETVEGDATAKSTRTTSEGATEPAAQQSRQQEG